NPRRDLARETRLELRHVQAEGLRMLDELGLDQQLLVGKEAVVHLPELALLARAVASLRRFERQRMDPLERELQEHVPDLSGVDILLLDLMKRIAEVSSAEGALKVGKLDQRELGVGVAL